MPFKSIAQNAWAHTPEGTKALGGQGKVKEWEKATDYKSIPQHLAQGGPVMALSKGSGLKDADYAKGGGELGRSQNWAKRDPQGRGEFGKFLGTADRFSGLEAEDRVAGSPKSQKTAEDWTKPAGVGRTDKDDKGDTKSLKPIKPRS